MSWRIHQTHNIRSLAFLGVLSLLVGCVVTDSRKPAIDEARQWLAGDHHIHSRYSVGWDREQNPPAPIVGGDAIYPIQMNAVMGKYFGLSWMVTTDHGGPNHSKVHLELAYPELVQSRLVVSEVIQFYGMELDTPGGEHSSLIIPYTHDEAEILHRLESDFGRVEAFPVDPLRDTEAKMLEALGVMRTLDRPPVVIANHPSRTASGDGQYGRYDPAEFRRWNDTAPEVAVGMAGAPGHQAISLTTNPLATNAERVGCVVTDSRKPAIDGARQWLAGDHHIHSRYSVGWDREQNPPAPIVGGDAIYPIQMNAVMGKYFGLSWMVTTDHGGPNHSKVHLELAYPELVQSRLVVSEVIQFYGMELDTPGGEHSSLIIPYTHDEAEILHRLESDFGRVEAFPVDPLRDTEAKMLEALGVMRTLDRPPVVIANHPSRTASGDGQYGRYDPAEFRRWNDTAPEVAVGMAGAPGHQAISLTTNPLATNAERLVRSGYGGFPTMGGFDQMTAKLGGFWDSMLGEGRRWWITANSDSHKHYSEGGVDFWPGEYSIP